MGLFVIFMIQITDLSNSEVQFEDVFRKTILEEFPEYSERARNYFVKNEKYKEGLFNGAISLGAYNKKKFVGYLFTDSPFAGVITVRWIAVLQEYQSMGIGKELLSELEKRAKSLGVHLIQLEADQRNVEYYRKRGYSVLGHYEKGYFGLNDYLMTKLIQDPQEEKFLI